LFGLFAFADELMPVLEEVIPELLPVLLEGVVPELAVEVVLGAFSVSLS
jgi:hypothetical protein